MGVLPQFGRDSSSFHNLYDDNGVGDDQVQNGHNSCNQQSCPMYVVEDVVFVHSELCSSKVNLAFFTSELHLEKLWNVDE